MRPNYEELLAQFEDALSHRAYYSYSDSNMMDGDFDPEYPLVVTADFNISPMAWLIGQQYGDGSSDTAHVLKEIVVKDTNTSDQCQVITDEIDRMLPGYMDRVRLKVYGDASGGTRATRQGAPSDIRIMQKHFGNLQMTDASFHFDKTNPLQKDRVAAVNRMLSNVETTGCRQRLFIDPTCKELLRDLRQVVWQSDSNKNTRFVLDKSDPDRTHASDALGYWIYKEFGWRGEIGFQSSKKPH